MASEDHVLLGFGRAGDLGDGALKTGTSPRRASLGFGRAAPALTVLGQPVHEPVRLATQIPAPALSSAPVPKILFAPHPSDHCDRMIPAAPAASSASGRARRSTPVFSSRSRHSRAARLALLRHAGHRLGPGELLQVLPRTATRLRSRDEDELPPHLRQPRLERFGGAGVLPESPPPLRRARSWPGLHAAAMPSSDRTRGETRSMWVIPRSQLRQVPYRSLYASMPHSAYFASAQSLAAGHGGRSGEARPDRVHHHLAERVDLRALDALLPDRPDYGVVGGKGLGRCRRGRDECQRAGESDSNRGLHGSLRERIGPVTPDTAPPSRR